jgi:PBP1b-binding outer membrane lipoprotein LpoB
MRLTYFKTKNISIILVSLLLFQSCSVYKKTPVTLDEAAKTNSRVLIQRVNKDKFKFKKIELIDGNYLGVQKVDGKTVSILLDEKDIQSIKVLDKAKTTLGNVALIIVSLGVIGLVIIASQPNDYGGISDKQN